MSRLLLDLEALQHNLRLARSWGPPGAKLRAMVKANAYGHGIEPLAATLVQHSDELGVATLAEGLELRSLVGESIPIFVMSGSKDWHAAYLEAFRRARLTPVISSLPELLVLSALVEDGPRLDIELKLDTGMGRLGVRERDIDELRETLSDQDAIRIVGLLTHLAGSDAVDLTSVREQQRCLRRMLDRLPRGIVQSMPVHSCNSGALMRRAMGERWIGEGTGVIRPGVMLYGAAPSSFLQRQEIAEQLEPVGRWTARVVELRTLEPGARVGYGGTWQVEGDRDARVAVLQVGYADGYRRELGGRARVLIRGASFPVVGRVSMDLVSVHVDESVRLGDSAVLLGGQGSEQITAGELAELCGTIPYEVWTGLGSRVERTAASE